MAAHALYMERALREAERELGENIVTLSYVEVGADASVHAELLDSDKRRIRNAPDNRRVEKITCPECPASSHWSFPKSAALRPDPMSIRRSSGATRATLKVAALEVKEALATLPGTISIDDNMPYGHTAIGLFSYSGGSFARVYDF